MLQYVYTRYVLFGTDTALDPVHNIGNEPCAHSGVKRPKPVPSYPRRLNKVEIRIYDQIRVSSYRFGNTAMPVSFLQVYLELFPCG
eukprot:SAG11_NODE_16551_length_544_cov_1.119101_1_plen_85_part_01